MQADRHDRIRERAYRIWLAEGRVEGKQDEHWRRAEREIAVEDGGAGARRSRSPRPAASATPKAPRRTPPKK